MKSAVALWALVLGLAVVGCKQAAPSPPPPPAASTEAASDEPWEPGKDIAGTPIVLDGVAQAMPEESAEVKRKMDAVYAEQRATMDELERKRLEKFSADSDLQP